MFVVVYGTLKQGYGNNRILSGGTGAYVRDIVVQGYKLYDSGFPVAIPSENDSIKGELWDIGDPETNIESMSTLRRLDGLEGEGRMYNRVEIIIPQDHLSFNMYVGHPRFWEPEKMDELPKDNDGNYYWERSY